MLNNHWCWFKFQIMYIRQSKETPFAYIHASHARHSHNTLSVLEYRLKYRSDKPHNYIWVLHISCVERVHYTASTSCSARHRLHLPCASRMIRYRCIMLKFPSLLTANPLPPTFLLAEEGGRHKKNVCIPSQCRCQKLHKDISKWTAADVLYLYLYPQDITYARGTAVST